MKKLLAATLATAALATACANPGAMKASPSSPAIGNADAPMPMAGMDPRMKAMKDMQEKMTNAKTPAERQALMADHMKAMQDGMAMMKEMHGGMQGMGAMGDGKSQSADMAKHHPMMAERMATMQTMMDMMAQRMPAAPAAQ